MTPSGIQIGKSPQIILKDALSFKPQQQFKRMVLCANNFTNNLHSGFSLMLYLILFNRVPTLTFLFLQPLYFVTLRMQQWMSSWPLQIPS